MIDFLLLYEHINREVENLSLLKYELEKRGYRCRISHYNSNAYWYHSLFSKAKVVAAPWLREDMNMAHYLPLCRKPHKLVDMQWEQVYTDKYLADGYCTIKDVSLKTYHLCWGKNSYDRLIEWGADERQLYRTGAIQLDFGNELFDGYYLDKEELGKKFRLDPTKRWILFISSFSYANYGEESIKKIESEFNCSLDYEVNLHQKSQKILLEWTKKLLAEDDCEFIYRPHPSENSSDVLSEMEASNDRFHVISKYSVKQWIKSCEVINTWISTSIAECYAMGRICNIVRPIPIKKELEVESLKNKTFVNNEDDYIKANIQEYDYKLHSSENLMAEFEKYYDFRKNSLSYIKTADVFEEVYSSDVIIKYELPKHIKKSYFKKMMKDIIVSFLITFEIRTGCVRFLIMPRHIKQNIINAAKREIEALLIEKRVFEYMKSKGV